MNLRIPANISFSTERDKDFLGCVYGNGDLSKYSRRLAAIGFEGLDRVIDAGSGFGQ
ncbi:MAG: hypothetical protein ACM3S2_20735 [Ignavibacteriales bacterium]